MLFILIIFIGIVPRNLIYSDLKPLSSLKLSFFCVETSNDSLSHFLSTLPSVEHRQELYEFTFLGFCSEVHPVYSGKAMSEPQVAQDQGYRNSGNMDQVITTQHIQVFICYVCVFVSV